MKRQVIRMVILLLAAGQFLFPVEFQKPRFYIKFNGIGSLADGGDFGDFVRSCETYFTGLNNSADSYDISVTESPYFLGYGGEIGVDTNKFAVGLSAGYLEKTLDIDYHYAAQETGFKDDYTISHTFSAVPIFLFIHYKIIDSRALTIFFTVGEGVYLAKYKDNRRETFEQYFLTFINSSVESKKNRLAFHIGTTIDLNITANLALSIEAAYRLASFKEMTAASFYQDDKQEEVEKGDLYYWINNRTGQSQFNLGAPAGKIFWDGLPARLNLNGFSLSAGLKITFGSKKKSKTLMTAPVD